MELWIDVRIFLYDFVSKSTFPIGNSPRLWFNSDGIMGKILVQDSSDEGVEPGTTLCIVLHEPDEAKEEDTK